jgi:pyruvate/2-oxoglutarate/acetoin dehydrogenase E1 component
MMDKRETVLDSLNKGLHQAFAADQRVYLLGEDILDPYGGAFKVSRGLSTAYRDRVRTTPISEAGIVGVAIGMALRGLLPVVEIMFGDFLTLAADQMINHLAKFPWMYSGGKSTIEQVKAPMVIRTPMGGRRGYGPTHSQTMEKFFLGIPGLKTLAPNHFGNPGQLLVDAILNDDDPILFIENKLQYLLPIETPQSLDDFELFQSDHGAYPVYRLQLRGAPPPQITLVAYGYMAELARQAMRTLAYDSEIFCELVIPTQLAPYKIEGIVQSVHKTNRLVVIEEGTLTLGWAAEVIARLVEVAKPELHTVTRVAALDLPIAASKPLEMAILPAQAQIISACQKIMNKGKIGHGG